MNMNYDQARDIIQDGDIIFLRRDTNASYIGNIIAFLTKSNYWHTGIATWLYSSSGDRRLFIVEAQTGGRRLIPLSIYADKYNFDVIAAPIKWDNYASLALEKIARVPYGYLDIITVGIKEIFYIPQKDKNGEICSEMVAKLLVAGGYNKLDDVLLSPGKLIKVLRDLGEKNRCTVITNKI